MAVSWALPAPLSPAQLKRLEQHRYSAAGHSLLEPWLQPYWGWLVEQVPRGLAPNAITLGGLLLNCLTALPLIACCPSATEQVPPDAAAAGRGGRGSARPGWCLPAVPGAGEPCPPRVRCPGPSGSTAATRVARPSAGRVKTGLRGSPEQSAERLTLWGSRGPAGDGC